MGDTEEAIYNAIMSYVLRQVPKLRKILSSAQSAPGIQCEKWAEKLWAFSAFTDPSGRLGCITVVSGALSGSTSVADECFVDKDTQL